MAASSASRATDLGMLGKLPLEIRWMVYEYALPPRILRLYEDYRKRSFRVEALGPPNLALVCRDTWDFCFERYCQVPFTPIVPNKHRVAEARWIKDPQITWFCPSIDSFYMDIPYSMYRMAQRQTPAPKNTGADAKQKEEVPMCWESLNIEFGDLLRALVPVAERIEDILISDQNEEFLKMAMRPDLFPQLKRILWAGGRSTLTQENRHGPRSWSRGSFMCRTFDLEWFRYDGNRRKKAFAEDRKALEIWHGSFSKFSTPGFQKWQRIALPDHRAFVERRMALARLYWETAYSTQDDGSRVYEYFDDWVCKIIPNSPEVVALLASLPHIELIEAGKHRQETKAIGSNNVSCGSTGASWVMTVRIS
ncbi:hypothetical protein PG995_011469 [Apiospora arundinis]